MRWGGTLRRKSGLFILRRSPGPGLAGLALQGLRGRGQQREGSRWAGDSLSHEAQQKL